MGVLIRCDHLGLASIVRWLFLTPESYDFILHFFRATSWQLEPLLSQWAQVAFKRAGSPRVDKPMGGVHIMSFYMTG